MLSIAPEWGRTGSAAERLWSARDASGLGADDEFEADSRIAIDAGYGFGLAHGQGRGHTLRRTHARGCGEPHGADRHALAGDTGCRIRTRGDPADK